MPFLIDFTDGYISFDILMDYGWHHFVIVLLGPTEENKLNVYHDGNKVDDEKIRSYQFTTTLPSGSGKLKIGTADFFDFVDTTFDELIFWNRPLTDNEAKSIYDSYSPKGN